MATPDLTDLVALRIGLAAKYLTGIELTDWLSILIRAVGLPLSGQRLGRLRLNRLRQVGSEALDSYSDQELRRAISLLRGQGFDLNKLLPQPQAYMDGDMPGSIRVACASNRSDRIDSPFGTCERFLVYQVSAQEQRLIDLRAVPDRAHTDDKHQARVALIQDCHVICALTIGGLAAAKIVNAGLHPIKVGAPLAATKMLGDLQQVLDTAPPPWLLKIMEASARQTWARQMEYSS